MKIELNNILIYPEYENDAFLFDITIFDNGDVVKSWSDWTKVNYESLDQTTTVKSKLLNS